jgi:asparagine synthase (glutamine-hydrolysing)
MSGVFGVAFSKQQSQAGYNAWQVGPLTEKIATVLAHRPWFATDHFSDEEQAVAIGRVGIGIFNKLPQPVWNSSRTVALVMAGEFYNRQELDRNELHKTASDEQFALSLYEQYGDSFAKHLNGTFIIAVWDQTRQQLLITNDRFGLYPLFYTCRAGRFIFAPEMKGILADDSFPRKLDLTALAQYMRFQHLLGERTFFEDIALLPNASVLIYEVATARCTITPYWSYADIPDRPDITFNEAVEEAGYLFRRAVQRMSGDAYRPGVFLSGGLDSRAILGLVERRPIVSLTYGQRDCRDVFYAQQIAKAVGSNHHWFDFPNGEWVKEQVDFHLDLTEGYHSWIHAHGMSVLPEARQLIDVNLTGWDGGTLMGDGDVIDPLQQGAVDEAALVCHLFYLFNQKYTWPSINEAEENYLYSEPLRQQMRGLAFDSFRAELSRFFYYRPDMRGEYFYIQNHCLRLTFNFITFTRSHIEVRFPFFDYDFFDFLHAIPPAVRGIKTMYKAVIQKEMPRLAYIPYDHDEFLPTPRSLIRNTHALGTKLKRRFNRHVRPIFPQRPTLYADYENYLRGELRPWAENILFDPCTTEHGLFNSAFLHTLMNRHLSGLEEWTIGKIAPIMTYELMLRRFCD